MSSIQAGIELSNQFTDVIYNMIDGINAVVTAIEEMSSEISQTTVAVNDFNDEIQSMKPKAFSIYFEHQEIIDMGMPPLLPDPLTESPEPLEVEIEPKIPDPLVAGPDAVAVEIELEVPNPLVESPEPIQVEIQPNTPPDQVLLPAQWHSADSSESFPGASMEHFQEQVQIVSNMLDALHKRQLQILYTAMMATFFSANTFTNLGQLRQELGTVQQSIEQISNHSIDIGGNHAIIEVEQLSHQISRTTAEQDQLNTAVQNMDVETANREYSQLAQTADETEDHIGNNVLQQEAFNSCIEKGEAFASALKGALSKAVEAFSEVVNIEKVIGLISQSMKAFDEQLNAEIQLMSVLANKLNDDYTAGYSIEMTAQIKTETLQAGFDSITAKANEIAGKGIYKDEVMIAGAVELATYFSDTDAIEMMMDNLANYAMGISGGVSLDSGEMESYAARLGEIMSGSYDDMTDKGFAFTNVQKAIIEGTATEAQVAAQLGEEYLGLSQDMQAAAAITQSIDKSWSGLYETMSNTPQGMIIQMTNAWAEMQEVIGKELYPYVLLFVNTIMNHWGTIETVIDGLIEGLQTILSILSELFEGALSFASLIVDNWSTIEPLIFGIAAALGIYAAIAAVVAVINGVMAAAEAAKTAALTLSTGVTFAATAGQHGLNAALAACPLVWIILLIIALVAALFAVCQAIANMTGIANTGFGVITGGINVVSQFFSNLELTVANIALGIGNAIFALASNMVADFYNAICSIKVWFYDLLSTALTVIEKICAALNKLPFVDFDYSGISDAANLYAAKAAEAEGNKKDHTSVSDAFNKGFHTFETFQDGWISDAFHSGAAWGDNLADSMSSKIDGFFDLFSLDIDPDIDPDATEIHASDYVFTLDNPEENPDIGLGAGSDINDIACNTKTIVDSMDITNEDLKYLRDIAEQDAINRFTLAEVNIEQTNNNHISSDMDLDGVVSGLTESVNEAVDMITEGVHA